MQDTKPAGSVELSDAEWRRKLTPEEYNVLRKHGTERAGTSALNNEKRRGVFVCAGCGEPVYDASTKFESGTGWPSFWAPVEGAVETQTDRSWFMSRTEVHCARCGGHLGHVFPDGPDPTGERHCINGVSLGFKASQAPADAAGLPRDGVGDRLTSDQVRRPDSDLL